MQDPASKGTTPDEKMDNPRKDLLDPNKKKYPSFWRNVVYYASEYTENSSIHGVRYIGERKRAILERLFWFVILGISLYYCADLIVKSYNKWNTSPVIVSFARSPTPIWEIPFPAITICSETKARRSVYNFTRAYYNWIEKKNISREEQAKFEQIALVCDNHIYHNGSEFIGYDTIDFLTEVAPPFEQALYKCKWLNENIPCDKLFVKTLTEEGICWTFNMLNRDELYTNIVYHNDKYQDHDKHSEWSLEDGYAEGLGIDTFPRRAFAAGQKAGMLVEMRAFAYDLDYICRGPVQGFKMALFHPAEVPRVSQQYIRAPLNQEVIVTIKPDMMTTSQGLRDYDPHRRLCFFPSERSLSFFKVYTQQNCDVECLANFTLKVCGCVAYHMPHREETKICGPKKIVCMHEAMVDYVNRRVQLNLEQENEDCDCLPACTSLSFNAETSQADYNWQKVFEAYNTNLSTMPGVQFTRAVFFFKEQQFINSERNELYGPTDFFASCGGLLGLFMGFSVLSIVEILYFLTLRIICNIRNYGHHFWSGSADLIKDEAYSY